MSVVEAIRGPRTSQIERHELAPANGLRFGKYTPYSVLTNEIVESWKIQKGSGKLLTAVDMKDLLGIDRRFIAAEQEDVVEMGFRAALSALGDERQIDAVLVSTSYPIGINVSAHIASLLELSPTYHTDIHAACSGFVRGLNEMYQQTKDAKASKVGAYDFPGKRVLFIASEKYSHTLVDLKTQGYEADPDMNQNIFSDGAVALVFTYGEDLEVVDGKNFPLPDEFALHIRMPIKRELAVAPFIMENVPESETGWFIQYGRGVYRTVLRLIPKQHAEFVGQHTEVTKVVPHQGTGKMVDSLARSKEMANYSIYKYMEDGNFSSASAPMAFMEAFKDRRIEPGDIIAIEQFGAGMFASTSIVRIGEN